jgi:acyl carrier protein
MKEVIIRELKEILELEDQELTLEDNFRDFDCWDSIANISVIAMLDEEFNININSQDLKQINTVGELIEEVKKRSKGYSLSEQ